MMNTLTFKLGDLSLIIFPDTQAHLDGHAIITRTYSLFRSLSKDNDALLIEKRKSTLLLANNDDPDYCGLITFEVPDKLFNYSAGALCELDRDQLEQVIEFLSNVRSNPYLWDHREI